MDDTRYEELKNVCEELAARYTVVVARAAVLQELVAKLYEETRSFPGPSGSWAAAIESSVRERLMDDLMRAEDSDPALSARILRILNETSELGDDGPAL